MSNLKVMCWNVENLFLPPPDDAASQGRFQRHLANLAAVIDREQPDVLALQEIGPDGALQALQEALTHTMPMPLRAFRTAGESAWHSSRSVRSAVSTRSSHSRR